MSLPGYERYKDSDFEWLGALPGGWRTSPIKHLCECCDDQRIPLNAQQRADRQGEVPYWGANSIVDYVDEALFDEDLILLGEDGAPFFDRTKAVAFFSQGPVWPNNHVHVLRPISAVSGKFIVYVLNSTDFAQFIDGSTRDKLTQGKMGMIPIPLPPLPEQRAIASFLDREVAKIDALVEQQKRLIELLKEKRQAVISHAVTKGVTEGVPMKDSGVEWLGEVPEHWEVGKFKYFGSVRGRIGFRGYTADDLVAEGEGALALGGSNLLDNGRVSLEKPTYISWEKYEESPEIKIDQGDILIGQRGTCGRVSMVEESIGPATINPSLVVLKELTVVSRFLCFWLNGDLIQNTFDSYLNKTAIPMLSQAQISNIPIVVPPETEQIEVASFLKQEITKIDELVHSVRNAIKLLQERRSALISAAVTGKIDVRGLTTGESETA